MSDDKSQGKIQANVQDSDSIFKGSAHATPPDLPPVHPVAVEKPSATEETKQ